jgi:hypothetical protein
VTPKEKIPEGRIYVNCKWVTHFKSDGIFRAKLVAWRYSQVSKIDLTESYAPVINDLLFGINLIRIMLCEIEILFLHSDLQ